MSPESLLTLKRPRNFEEEIIQLNPRPNPPPPPPVVVNKGTTNNNNNIFFKTRMCAKFKVGMCRNGEGCNFAHGVEDLRQPPPNWQQLVGAPRGEDNNSDHRSTSSDHNNWDDDQKIIHKMKLCKKFYNGEECPYGDRCNFLHEERAKFRDDSWRFRETSAICIGTTTTTTATPEAPPAPPITNYGVGGGLDPRLFIMKPAYWKTKLCTKWEITGLCPFGDKCHFAHGLAELQAHGGRIEGEATSMASPQQLMINEMCCISAAAAVEEKQAAKRTLLKWKGPKKINQVYADWLDDIPLVQNMPHNSEI